MSEVYQVWASSVCFKAAWHAGWNLPKSPSILLRATLILHRNGCMPNYIFCVLASSQGFVCFPGGQVVWQHRCGLQSKRLHCDLLSPKQQAADSLFYTHYSWRSHFVVPPVPVSCRQLSISAAWLGCPGPWKQLSIIMWSNEKKVKYKGRRRFELVPAPGFNWAPKLFISYGKQITVFI